MYRPIPTKVHGVLDYLSVPSLLALPRVLGWNSTLTNTLTGIALSTLGLSIFTRYELGLVKWLPMKGHLASDMLTGATIAATPFLVANKRERNATMIGTLIGLGLFEIAAATLTQTHSSLKEDQ